MCFAAMTRQSATITIHHPVAPFFGAQQCVARSSPTLAKFWKLHRTGFWIGAARADTR
jgi:hypothetical protein